MLRANSLQTHWGRVLTFSKQVLFLASLQKHALDTLFRVRLNWVY